MTFCILIFITYNYHYKEVFYKIDCKEAGDFDLEIKMTYIKSNFTKF